MVHGVSDPKNLSFLEGPRRRQILLGSQLRRSSVEAPSMSLVASGGASTTFFLQKNAQFYRLPWTHYFWGASWRRSFWALRRLISSPLPLFASEPVRRLFFLAIFRICWMSVGICLFLQDSANLSAILLLFGSKFSFISQTLLNVSANLLTCHFSINV